MFKHNGGNALRLVPSSWRRTTGLKREFNNPPLSRSLRLGRCALAAWRCFPAVLANHMQFDDPISSAARVQFDDEAVNMSVDK
jgi:hypothetical protein